MARKGFQRSRLLVALVMIVAMVAPLASPSPARAVGQVLQWDDGSSFKVFGANEAIFIAIGTINTDCDQLFATADVYVIQGGASEGAALSDVNGQPNTVVAGGGGFFSETIAFTQPSGSLGQGLYSVVYDECQDGEFDTGTDAVFTDAFQVELPSTLPPIDPSIAALKSRAGQQADRMKTALNLLELYEAYQEIQEAIECITSPGDCIAGMIVDEITGAILDQIRLFLGLGVDPKVAARDAALDTISHYEGIEADPPDPAFEQHTIVPQPAPIDPETGDALVGAEVALGNAHQSEGALAEALLHAIERYQGAQAAEDGDWALVHARQIQSFSTLLAAQLSDSNAAASDLVAALGADPRDIDLVSTTLAPDRQRIVASGFLPEEEQLLLNLGLTTAEIDALQARIAEYTDPISESDLVAALNDLIATNDAAIPTLQTLASDMDAVIAIALVDPDTDDSFPVADAGGPYVAAAGANVTLDGSGSIALAGSLVAHDWDLDGDGQFDDASGATPGVSFATPFAGVIGLRVTDDAGHTGVGHAAITVSAINSPPVITAFSPDAFHPEIIVGTTQEFSVTSSDPDGDPVSVSWLLDGVSAGSGASFSYSPLEADGLGGHWVRAVVSAGGDTRVHDWTPLVLLEDGDADGWRANVDCDDTDATVNRGATEILGNGKDDDCDAATPDAGDAPVALFNPVMSGGGSNAASYEQGARTVAVSSTFPVPQYLVDNMLDDYVGNPDSNQWFAGASNPFAKIDLVGDEPVLIDRVRIQSAPSFGVTQFEIAVSTTTIDDSAFTPVLTTTISASDTVREFVLPTPVLAKFVRYRPLSGGANFTKRLQTWTGQVGTDSTVTFSNRSTDANDDIVSYEWDFGDGSPPSSATSPTHTFPGVGDYTVTLTVTDAIGNTGVFSVLQRILPPPPPPDILLFGPTLAAGATSTEYAEAVKLGLVPRIVTNPEWQALTTADFAGYRAIVFGDSRSSDPFLMNLAAANGSTWGPAITGNIIAFGGDAAVHASRGGADMINRLIQFAIEQPGKTGAVVLLGQYYYNVGANTPVAVLDVMRPGEFRIQGAGCFEPARFTASHPAFVGLTDANLLGWGCVVHEVFNLWPSDFVVITAAAGFGTYVNTDGTVGQPHIVAIGTNITPITRITLAPASATNDPGQSQTLTATVKKGSVPTPNMTVTLTVNSGPHTGVIGTGVTNASGVTTFSYTGSQGGTDEIVATFVHAGVTHTSNIATVAWSEPSLSVDAGDDLAAIEGDQVSLSGAAFSDSVSPGNHTATIDWGDGTVENGIVTEILGSVGGSHIYMDDRTFTVEVCVTNAGAITICDTLIVTVGNVPPIVSASAAPVLTAGTAVTLDLATFTDPGTLDTHIATIDWGDGTVEAGTLSQGAGSGTVSGTHAYAVGGDYTVTITVTDDDGDGGSATLDVTVANSNGPPTLTAIGDQTLDEGTTLDVALSALDPDTDPLVLSATGLPAFATFTDHGDGSGTLTLTPSFDDAGA
ncbi:MAG: PKD domain-containing protein, partial [Chloroflexota bacterium]